MEEEGEKEWGTKKGREGGNTELRGEWRNTGWVIEIEKD